MADPCVTTANKVLTRAEPGGVTRRTKREERIMTNTFLSNGFSLNMLADPDGCNVKITGMTPDEVANTPWFSVMGHADTASVVGNAIGVDVPMNRATVALKPGDRLIVAQLHGPRLPEGATTLPDGAVIKFWKLDIV
jgi:hypothetical protein